MAEQPFEQLLTGGHPNSLGNTVAVVDTVLAEPARLAELFACYGSADAVVRLRTSNALKRVAAVEPTWLVPDLDRLLGEVAQLDQPSAQWTLAQLCATLRTWLRPQLERLSRDPRTSVAGRAKKLLAGQGS